jgi:uncharacterized protein (DUF1330 family)
MSTAVRTPASGEGMSMAYQLVVGLQVDDREMYSRYRNEIKPLLEAAGANFLYDFEIDRTLVSTAEHGINRVFVLAFPDREAKERFFADSRYRAIRTDLFETAVSGTTILAECNA